MSDQPMTPDARAAKQERDAMIQRADRTIFALNEQLRAAEQERDARYTRAEVLSLGVDEIELEQLRAAIDGDVREPTQEPSGR